MITPKTSGSRIVFGPCRLSYTHVFNKFDPGDGSEGKFMTNVLIPKSEIETLNAIKQAIEAAVQAGVSSPKVFKGKRPAKLDLPLRAGAEKNNAGEEYRDVYYLNAKSARRPGVVDKHNNPITDEEEIYSGVWCYVSLSFYAYNRMGNCGVGVSLDNIKKYKDDERFGGGRPSAENDFAGIGDDSDDDDM